jgi:endonuclease YncB( thermonuclease family)
MGAFPVPQAAASGLPDCAGSVEMAAAHIVRVERNGTLVLSDGRKARLEGIRLPAGASDHAPQAFADQAHVAVSKLTVGRTLTLTAVSPIEDRYGRIRVQAFSGERWVQEELLKRGLARVSISPDRIECASEIYKTETEARTARAGLWSLSAYAIRGSEDLKGDLGTFQIVEGKVYSAQVKDGSAWLDFGSGQKGAFAAVILPDDLRIYRAMGVDPRGYAGRIVRVRGVIQDLAGPAIAIANPIQVEVIQ